MKVLVVAPHADDEVLGVGGSIARHSASGDSVSVAIMTGHGENPHPLWTRETWVRGRAEAAKALELLGVDTLIFEEIPAAQVVEQPLWQLNAVTKKVLDEVRPDVLYVPFPFDMHKDHREIFHSFSVAWRPSNDAGGLVREVYAYETQSETHWNAAYLEPGFLPNTWVDIGDFLDRKLAALACYESQVQPWPHARSLEAVSHLARWRGSQMGMEAAEAFVLIRRLMR